MTNCGPTLTDVRDPKIDEKPPPYDCSGCGFSTWSWNEAKRHACGTMRKELRNLTEAGRTATSILSALIDSSAVRPLIQMLERAHDGSTGEFKESSITLPSRSGSPTILRVRRRVPDVQGSSEKQAFSVDLEISHQE